MGRFLRLTSLDELQQLWNVVRGRMSLVGPRPLLMEYLAHYTAEQNRRHSVLPGITGWAHINGRNLTGFSERLKLDLWYVDHWSLWIDIKIMARTLINVLRSSGVKLEQSLTEIDDIGLHPDTRKKAVAAVLECGVATVRNQQPENTFRGHLFSRLALPSRSCRRLTVRAGRAVILGRSGRHGRMCS
jgi:hypothetical protein